MLLTATAISELVAFASAGLKIGKQAYDIAQELRAEGVDVPGLDEYEARTQEVKDLPDLVDIEDE